MRLSALYIYPVKSAKGLEIQEGEVGDRGFAGDRRFMVVDSGGHFLSQRRLPRMALLQVTLKGDRLQISAPGVGLDLAQRPEGGEGRRVRVWKDDVDAWSMGPEAAGQLSQFLGRPCELVYMPDATERQIDREYAPAGYHVGFADGFPYLLTSTASLEELARRGAPVEMIRFRPNLVVDGALPFAEDQWKRIRIGEVRFVVAKPCARCSIPNVNPETGEEGEEPTRTLVGFRKIEGKVRFGQNLYAEGTGVVRIGDEVTIEA